MRLFEHPDFEQLVLRAAAYFRPRGLRAAVIEKDYHVTEALRIVAASGERIIFKGGTSLAKRLEPDRAVLGRHRHLPRSSSVRAGLGQESHRPGTQETP